ncbi:MAG: alpha/beta hydrolase-fold protein [Chloroflexota bacterium]|nr:alpha/beta hydrolase-fold protein [Chloroflexota bacterium]
MKRDYRKWHSPALDREMELLVFGERGTPTVVFPTSMGRFYQWEDFGMIAHLGQRIEAGQVQLWCVDSVDAESFYNKQVDGHTRARRHLAYDRYLSDEVVPAVRRENGDPSLDLLGASFGAFHAVTLAARHPGIANRVIGLSGAYDASRWLDGFREQDAYFANPLAFLPGLTDEAQLRPLRQTQFVIATGVDDPNVAGSREVVAVLQDKAVPADLHLWNGWAHDWPFWKEMVDRFL